MLTVQTRSHFLLSWSLSNTLSSLCQDSRSRFRVWLRGGTICSWTYIIWKPHVKYNYFHKEQRPRYTPNPFVPQAFIIIRNRDFYVCPMGQHMKRIGMKRSLTSNGFVTYSVRYQAERCDGCPLRGSCFKARGNRIIEVNHQLSAL